MTSDANQPAGPRVLVVEDEFLVGLLLEADLRDNGFTILGPFTDLGPAVEAARSEAFDLAILDVNLNGTMVFPLADELTGRKIPFMFLSGYAATNLPERFRSTPRISKPYDPALLMREIAKALRPGP